MTTQTVADMAIISIERQQSPACWRFYIDPRVALTTGSVVKRTYFNTVPTNRKPNGGFSVAQSDSRLTSETCAIGRSLQALDGIDRVSLLAGVGEQAFFSLRVPDLEEDSPLWQEISRLINQLSLEPPTEVGE